MYDEMDIDVMIGISEEELPTGREIPVVKKPEETLFIINKLIMKFLLII